jgi:hypothetical protein
MPSLHLGPFYCLQTHPEWRDPNTNSAREFKILLIGYALGKVIATIATIALDAW